MSDLNLGKIRGLWSIYIDKYFEGDRSLWHCRNYPYIFYKHLFRKFLYGKLNSQRDLTFVESQITGKSVDRSTIANSINKDPKHFKLSKKELSDIIKFLHKYWGSSLQNQLQLEVRLDGFPDNSYIKENTWNKLKKGVKLPFYVLKQMEQELYETTQ